MKSQLTATAGFIEGDARWIIRRDGHLVDEICNVNEVNESKYLTSEEKERVADFLWSQGGY